MKLFHLLPLQCPKCGSPIDSNRNDVIYFCNNCGAGLEFNGEKLELVRTVFARPELDKENEPQLFLPFWLFHLDISIKGKEVYLPFIFRPNFLETQDSLLTNKTLLEKILKKREEQTKKEEMDFSIYVPSFPTTGTFEYSSNIGNRFTKTRPKLTFYEEKKKMESCIYNSSDALSIAEDEYISLQSAVIPNLLGLELSFNVKEKMVIGIPYIKKEKGIYYDQIIGEIIVASALKGGKRDERGV